MKERINVISFYEISINISFGFWLIIISVSIKAEKKCKEIINKFQQQDINWNQNIKYFKPVKTEMINCSTRNYLKVDIDVSEWNINIIPNRLRDTTDSHSKIAKEKSYAILTNNITNCHC